MSLSHLYVFGKMSMQILCPVLIFLCVCVEYYELCVCLVTQLCPTLCKPRNCSLLGTSVWGDSPGKNTGVGFPALLQGILITLHLFVSSSTSFIRVL